MAYENMNKTPKDEASKSRIRIEAGIYKKILVTAESLYNGFS